MQKLPNAHAIWPMLYCNIPEKLSTYPHYPQRKRKKVAKKEKETRLLRVPFILTQHGVRVASFGNARVPGVCGAFDVRAQK